MSSGYHRSPLGPGSHLSRHPNEVASAAEALVGIASPNFTADDFVDEFADTYLVRRDVMSNQPGSSVEKPKAGESIGISGSDGSPPEPGSYFAPHPSEDVDAAETLLRIASSDSALDDIVDESALAVDSSRSQVTGDRPNSSTGKPKANEHRPDGVNFRSDGGDPGFDLPIDEIWTAADGGMPDDEEDDDLSLSLFVGAENLFAEAREPRAPYRDMSGIVFEDVAVVVNDPSNHSTFPVILHFVLSCGHFRDCIAWTRTGRAFVIFDEAKFFAQVTPSFFCTSSRELFLVWAKKFGFQEFGDTWSGAPVVIFYHERFLYFREWMAYTMKPIRRNIVPTNHAYAAEVFQYLQQLPEVQPLETPFNYQVYMPYSPDAIWAFSHSINPFMTASYYNWYLNSAHQGVPAGDSSPTP